MEVNDNPLTILINIKAFEARQFQLETRVHVGGFLSRYRERPCGWHLKSVIESTLSLRSTIDVSKTDLPSLLFSLRLMSVLSTSSLVQLLAYSLPFSLDEVNRYLTQFRLRALNATRRTMET